MMISRRNFAMLTAIMLVVLFMFQSTGVAKNQLNDAETNEYALESQTQMEQSEAFSLEQAQMREVSDRSMVVFLGDTEDNPVYDVICQWCTYTKRGIWTAASAQECEGYLEQMEFLLVDSRALDLDSDVAILQGYVDAGANLVFCNLPDAQTMAERIDLEELLGITAVYETEKELTGVELFDGFLLGGMKIYQAKTEEEAKRQDMDLTVPWYLTLNANKTFMIGLIPELKSQGGQTKNEYAPSLIWRSGGDGRGQVYVVNGAYLEDVTGIGILEAFAADINDYELYPVVNAQVLAVANYPSFANENSEEIEERYSRELPSLYRDVIWQSISSVVERDRSKTTMLLAPQYDYEDENEPLGDSFTYYAKLFREKRMEIGLSMEQVSQVSLEEKVERDLSFLNENLPDYEYRSVYMPKLDDASLAVLEKEAGSLDITTVLTDYDPDRPLLSYESGKSIQQSTNNAFSHTYTEDLRTRSLESALGYTSVLMDMDRVAYPTSDADNWEKLGEEFSANYLTYWKDYTLFDKTTLSESDARIRRFLNLDYTQSREDDEITLDITNFEGEAFFILRTHGEKIAEVENGSFQELEDDAFLIKAESEKIVIALENNQIMEYY
jgi:hypothetical protein